MRKNQQKLSEDDREAIGDLKERMDQCWFELTCAERTEMALNELYSIHSELSQILGRIRPKVEHSELRSI